MNIVTDVILPLALAFIMFVLGLGLTGSDFLRVIKQPRDFFVGAISQIVLLPIIAFFLVKIWPIAPELAIGVMIIAAAPGGVTSNVLTKFANGDVALSVSLTAVISLVSIITVPFIVFKSADLLNINYQSAEISMIGISMKMFLVVTFPVLIGMLIRKFATNFISSKEQLIQRISVFLFALVFLAILIEEKENIIPYLAEAGLITLILNLTMMILGFYIAKKFASGIAQRKCISLECGLQNGTLAIFVSTQIFDNSAYLVPTATYALIMFITSIIFVFIVKRSS